MLCYALVNALNFRFFVATLFLTRRFHHRVILPALRTRFFPQIFSAICTYKCAPYFLLAHLHVCLLLAIGTCNENKCK